MLKVARVVLLAAAMMAPPLVSHAARDHSEPQVEAMSYELVVFEVDGCIYCDVFKRDVLPLYRASDTSRKAPMRFVNLSYVDETKMALSEAVTIAPTVVLMHNGREVDRITGYTGPVTFVQLVRRMMGEQN